MRKWLGWSAKYKWVSRSLAREEWIASTSDEQIIINTAPPSFVSPHHHM